MNKLLINGIYYNQTADLTLEGTVVAITGHRPDKLGHDYTLTSPLVHSIRATLQALIDLYKPNYMISGMALGIDTVWAKLAIKNKIPLVAAVPFLEQDRLWNERDKQIYRDLLLLSEYVVNVSGQLSFRPQYMQQRNVWMINHCTRLIAVWDSSNGGTGNCVKWARQVLREDQITVIDPRTFLHYSTR